jgi:hypothetical protein
VGEPGAPGLHKVASHRESPLSSLSLAAGGGGLRAKGEKAQGA